MRIQYRGVNDGCEEEGLLAQKGGLVLAGALVECEGDVEGCGCQGEAGEEAGEEPHEVFEGGGKFVKIGGKGEGALFGWVDELCWGRDWKVSRR